MADENDIVARLRATSGKVNQLIGALRVSSYWNLFDAETRQLLTGDGPDLLNQAADEILKLRSKQS